MVRLFDLGGGGGDAGALVGGAHVADCPQHGGGAGEGGGVGLRRAGALADIGGEAASRHVAALHLRQVDVSARLVEEIRPFREGDVDMGVDGQQAAVQLKGVLGHADTVGRGAALVKGATASKPRRFV